MADLTRQQIEHIFRVHELGDVQTLNRTTFGERENAYIVNSQYILRLRAGRHMPFYAEQQAYAVLAAANVPVPRVIVVDTSGLRIPYSYMLLAYIPGQPLTAIWPKLNAAQREALAFEAGVYLARIHAVSFDFCGEFGPANHQRFSSFYEYAIDFCARFVLPASQTRLYTPQMHEQLAALLHACRPYIQHAVSCLVHGDYHLKNILVQGDAISGILNPERPLAGDAAWDFLMEDKWEEDCPNSRAPLYEGYCSVRRLDAQHRLKVRLYKALHFLEIIAERPEQRIWATERFQRLFNGYTGTSGDAPPHSLESSSL
jgi:aminoglycoside phosphotransferase (APT) family kinase protein